MSLSNNEEHPIESKDGNIQMILTSVYQPVISAILSSDRDGCIDSLKFVKMKNKE